jgi:hypothetical protein
MSRLPGVDTARPDVERGELRQGRVHRFGADSRRDLPDGGAAVPELRSDDVIGDLVSYLDALGRMLTVHPDHRHYSAAPEAATKRRFDEAITLASGRPWKLVQLGEDYFKSLIEMASGGQIRVKSAAPELQFFIIRGGGEGFLPTNLPGGAPTASTNADDVLQDRETPGGVVKQMRMDFNDILIAFGRSGELVDSVPLMRPRFIPRSPGDLGITAATAEGVYSSWDGRGVFVYRDTSFTNADGILIPYLGIAVDDPYRLGHPVLCPVDIHKEEGTNGCILIWGDIWSDTAPEDPIVLGMYEPRFTLRVLAAAGLDPATIGHSRTSLGSMRMITIS